MSTENRINKIAEIFITREFNAPKKIVFNAFAKKEALAQWWGPPNVPISVVKLDFRPNGVFHYKAEMQGLIMWGRFVYKQINEPDVLEFISSFSDEMGKISRAPFSDKFPLEIFNHFEFSEQNGKTTIKLSGYPIHATEDEMQAFIEMNSGMQQGFAGTFNQLDEYLLKIQKLS